MADKLILEFATNLERGSKSLQMYSETHPQTQRALQETYESILKLFENRDSVSVSVFQGNLLVDGEIVQKGSLVMARLSRDLSARNIDTLKILRGLKLEELFLMLRHLILSPQRLLELGGFEKILSDNGIQTIQINKVKYGIIQDDALPGIDPSMLSELLLAVQTSYSGSRDVAEVAENVEKSLEMNHSVDPGGMLLRLFQVIAQRGIEVSEGADTGRFKQNFAQLYRSFSPSMQTKLLLTSLLHESPEKNGAAFYQQLSQEELQSSILHLLEDPSVQNQLKELAARIRKDERIVLSDDVIQKMREKNLFEPEASLTPPSIAEEILKKESLTTSDIEKIPDALHELIQKGDLQDADQLSKRLFSYLGSGQPEQKRTAIELLPAVIRALSKNEKWKNVEFSLSFLILTCYRKETSLEVLRAYVPLLLAMFIKNYESKNWSTSQDVLSTIRIQTERHDSIRQEFTDGWIKIGDSFIEHIREGDTGVEVVLDGFHIAGRPGVSFLIDLLADEDDQKVRSRLISFIVSFRSDVLYPELEKRMSDTRWFVVRNMVTLVSKIQSTELPEFLDAAAVHPDPRIPKELIKILYKGTATSQLRLIVLLMEHPQKNVRMQAVHLVTMQSSVGAIPALLKLLESSSIAETDLRTACLQALLKLRSLEGIIPAATLLDRKPVSKAEIGERNAAVRLLGEVAREQTRTVLERTAQTDPNPETRALAASYL